MMDIEKIVRETKPQFSAVRLMNENRDGYFYPMSPEWLKAYTNEIIELCAKECNKIAWSNKNTPMLGAELNAIKCEEAIRNLKG